MLTAVTGARALKTAETDYRARWPKEEIMEDGDNAVGRGSKNIFADLGYADPETHLVTAKLVTRIRDVIAANELTQMTAAKGLGLGRPDVSRILRGHVREVSVERLMRMLTKLSCAVDIPAQPPT
jgi:predicted XRE-type DNA-binding protein